MGYQFIDGRVEEAQKLHMVSRPQYHEDMYSDEFEQRKWLQYVTAKDRKKETRTALCTGDLDVVIELIRNAECSNRQQDISRQRGLDQSVLRANKRRVKGPNGRASAQLSRLRGSTQTIPSEFNRVKHPCSDCHGLFEAFGAARVPKVVSREGRIRLLSEKGPHSKSLLKRQIGMS